MVWVLLDNPGDAAFQGSGLLLGVPKSSGGGTSIAMGQDVLGFPVREAISIEKG